LFQVTTRRPDPGRKAAADAWRVPEAARAAALEIGAAWAGDANTAGAVAAAAAATTAAAIAFRVRDVPGWFFSSLVMSRMSTNTLSRHVGFNLIADQFEILLPG
jgi:hypothetical protein